MMSNFFEVLKSRDSIWIRWSRSSWMALFVLFLLVLRIETIAGDQDFDGKFVTK